ncbi:MAG: hypothetical protein KatS3mg105_2128 [Gemmatales bacterium]|nr:MAG: hypothetical protein KatS3mg105_2128 [Gemmatales bacterium]
MLKESFRARLATLVAAVLLVVAGCQQAKTTGNAEKETKAQKQNKADTSRNEKQASTDISSKDLLLVPDQAVGFASLRVARLWNSPLAKQYRKLLPPDALQQLASIEQKAGLAIDDIKRVTAVVLAMPKGEEEPPSVVIVSTTKPFDPDKLKQAPNIQAKTIDGRKFYVGKQDLAIHVRDDGLIFFGKVVDIESVAYSKKGSSKEGVLRPMLALAEEHDLVAGVTTEPIIQRFGDMTPEGYEAAKKIKLASLVLDLQTEIDLLVTLEFAESKDAEAVKKMLDGLVALANFFMSNQVPPDVQKVVKPILDSVKVNHQGKRVSASLQMSQKLLSELPPMIESIGRKANQVDTQNNLKMIGLAFHDYHDTYGEFPRAAITRGGGKPLLSWRVAILPFIGQGQLYRQFKLDEPWDSPHNKKLLAKMPKVFETPGRKAPPGETYFRVFTGKGAIFDGDKPIALGAIANADGTSNTILVVEAAESVPWTKPSGLPFGKGEILKLVGRPGEKTILVLFADGSVRSIPRDEGLLRKMITAFGGEAIDNK